MQGTGSFRLIVRRGPQPNQIYELNKDIITIGRDITNDIVINDPEVSRHHARMTRGGGGYTLEDLGSTNGTFINGQRLTGARPLASGDLISLGETVTLGYEATMPASEPGQQPTMMSSSPPPPSQQPAYMAQQPTATFPQQQQQQQYGAQYAPPPPPPPQYQYQDQQSMPGTSGGLGRWFFLGCGCLIVLCIVLTVALLVYVDSNNLWCSRDIPFLRSVVDIIFRCTP
jgi:pSer/pThr/pTyr-binding forkhead associated (FHA) protein